MKLSRNDFFKWAKNQTQWTENELLNPHNPDVADSETVDVLEEIEHGDIKLDGYNPHKAIKAPIAV